MADVVTIDATDVRPRPADPPRIWTVFATFGAMLVAILVGQVAAAAGVAAWHLGRGGDAGRLAAELPELAMSPWGFVLSGLASQAAILLVAVVPARLSRRPLRDRLGLVRPSLPAWGVAAAAVGSLAPLAVGLGLALALAQVLEPSDAGEQLYGGLTRGNAVPFLLFVTLAPAVAEELFFRGYMQRRLLERWPAAAAIGVTALIFAVMHVTPHGIVATFPLGVWFGLLAWRTGSVVPGMLGHAAVNGSWNAWQIGVRLAGLPETPPAAAWAPVGVAAAAGFVATLVLMRREAPPLLGEN